MKKSKRFSQVFQIFQDCLKHSQAIDREVSRKVEEAYIQRWMSKAVQIDRYEYTGLNLAMTKTSKYLKLYKNPKPFKIFLNCQKPVELVRKCQKPLNNTENLPKIAKGLKTSSNCPKPSKKCLKLPEDRKISLEMPKASKYY